MTPYVLIYMLSCFIAAISQVLLKKAAMKQYDSFVKEYLNPFVIIAYFMFFGTTVLGIWAYKVIPLNLGPILDTTNYIYITIFGVIIFKEKMNRKKMIALGLIITGILIYTL